MIIVSHFKHNFTTAVMGLMATNSNMKLLGIRFKNDSFQWFRADSFFWETITLYTVHFQI